MKRTILLAAGFLAVAVAIAGAAEMKKVLRKSGSPVIGEVVETDDAVEVRTEAGVVTVPKDDVLSITDYVTFEEEYAKRLLALESDDVAGRYGLALWCYKQGKLQQAQDEFRKVLKLEPEHENATLYLQLIEEELAERERPESRRPRGPFERGSRFGDLVGEEDIYRVNRAELRSTDKVAVQFRDRADERFIKMMRGRGPFADPGYERVFRRKRPVAKAVDMLDLAPKAEDLHADIIVRTNPEFMVTFKTRIWPIVQPHCASSKCHGGLDGAGRLKLYNVRSRADALYYTNFLILDAFANNQGRMIDRANPAKSLLLQYGLPKELAAMPHPTEIPPVYRDNERDPRYRQVYDWIRTELLRPHPEYNLEYDIPGASPIRKRQLFDTSGEASPGSGDEGEASEEAK